MLGWVSALDVKGRTIWIVDAHGYAKRFIVRADEKLTAFVEGAIRGRREFKLHREVQSQWPPVRQNPASK